LAFKASGSIPSNILSAHHFVHLILHRLLTLEVEGLWWSNLQRFQRPDGYGGTETDEEAMKGFIAKELQVEPEDVKLARLWLGLYHPET
jgi:hypothetical protein